MPKRLKSHSELGGSTARGDYARYDKASQHKLQTLRTSKRWRRLRRILLGYSPLCSDPFLTHKDEGIPEPATELHHIVAAGKRTDLFFTVDNISPVCYECHGELTSRERARRPLESIVSPFTEEMIL